MIIQNLTLLFCDGDYAIPYQPFSHCPLTTPNPLRRHTFQCRHNHLHETLYVKLHPIDRCLPMCPIPARDLKPMIRHIPVICARHVHHATMPRAQYPLTRILTQHNPTIRPRPMHTRRRRISHTVVLRPGIVNRIRQVKQPCAIIHKDALTEIRQSRDGPRAVLLQRHHIFGELRVQRRHAVAPE
jgi:hypothetical protein